MHTRIWINYTIDFIWNYRTLISSRPSAASFVYTALPWPLLCIHIIQHYAYAKVKEVSVIRRQELTYSPIINSDASLCKYIMYTHKLTRAHRHTCMRKHYILSTRADITWWLMLCPLQSRRQPDALCIRNYPRTA